MLNGLYVQGTEQDREKCIKELQLSEVVKNTFDNIEFDSLLEIYKYTKKKKISKGKITNKYGIWGDVSKLLNMKQKDIILYF